MAIEDLITLKATYSGMNFGKLILDILVDEIVAIKNDYDDKVNDFQEQIDALEARIEALEG